LLLPTILDVIGELRKDDPEIPFLAAGEPISTGKTTEFELVLWNGNPRFVPSEALVTSRAIFGEKLIIDPKRGRPFMYRGQTRRYPSCFSVLYRQAKRDEWHIKALIGLERFRVAELELLLLAHPFTAVASQHGAWVDWHGLAQHYGIPTSLLDLTTDMRIAAFFAVAQWNDDSQSYTPMTNGSGVFYRFDWTAFGQGYSKFFNPVGFGPGLRPARQHAWTFHLKPFVNFEDVPHVSVIEFEHSAEASAQVFKWFNNGQWLMPPDCLVNLVSKVRDLPFVTVEAVRHAAKQDGQSQEQLEASVEQAMHFLHTILGTEFLDGYRLEMEDTDTAIAKQQAAELDKLIATMSKGMRFVRSHRGQELQKI
jgi:FRG domain